jgi:hypothetical protein
VRKIVWANVKYDAAHLRDLCGWSIMDLAVFGDMTPMCRQEAIRTKRGLFFFFG